MNGAFPCGFEWWQKHDLGQDINVTNKISDIAKRVLMAVDSTLYNEIYEELFELPDIGSGDPIAKVIESTIILFPSVSGLLSEVMHAVDLSPEALTALNLSSFRNKFKLFLELATSSSCINDSPTTFNVLKERILNLVNVGGTPGSIEEIKSDIEKLMMCGLKFSGKFVPEMISSSTLKKFDVVVDRLGISKFKNKFADFLG
ncbi:hypothetical protein EB796_018923 [Bugula neritina]|uniref:Uncharacterized protein n=1 Tax=Bugula neritina TaxID=10212 RepID=A0A7J7J9T2_BUGNE|nr:hypothetical protein EB796_018923 [Bugula neritina]